MTSGMERAGTTTGRATGGWNGGMRQGDQLQEAASGLVNQAARTAEAQASTTMTRVGETVHHVAEAVRDAAAGLRDQQPDVATIVDGAADRLDDASAYLRDHDAGEAISTIQDMARQQPAIVIGGGLAIGLLLGRALRSTTGRSQDGSSVGDARQGEFHQSWSDDTSLGHDAAPVAGGPRRSGSAGTALRGNVRAGARGRSGTSPAPAADLEEGAATGSLRDEALAPDEREVR